MKPSHFSGLFVCALSTSSAFALDGTTAGAAANANYNWNSATTAPWVGGVVAGGVGFTANFTAELSGANSTTTIATGNKTIGTIVFTDGTTSSHNLTIAASGTLQLILNDNANSPVLNVTQSNRELGITAPVGGANGFTKNGPGTLFLGNDANTFTGTITLNQGTLRLNDDGNLGAAANDLVLTGNSTLSSNSGTAVILNSGRSISAGANNLTFNGFAGNNRSIQVNGSITGSGNFAVSGATSNLTLTGANSFSGAIAIGAGGQTSSASNHTVLQVGTSPTNTTATLGNGSNAVTLGGFGVADEGAAGSNGSAVLRFTRNDYTFSGPIGGAGIVDIGLNDTNNSNGSTITLSGDNSYTGMTRIFQGALKVASTWDGSTGALSAANLRFDQHAVLIIAGDLDPANAADFTRAVGTAENQVRWTNGGGFAASGADRTVDIGGSGASFSWSNIGTSNALFLSHPDADAKLVFANPLDLTATAGNRAFRVHNGSAAIDGEISAAITGGTGVGISKSDGGTLLLSGTSTYDGSTLVTAGTLLVNGELGDTAVTVNSATLGGMGSIDGSVLISANGTLTPGNSLGSASAGTLTINNSLTLAGIMAMDINGLSAGSEHDQVSLNGTGTLGGTLTLAWSLFSPAALFSEIVLIANDDFDAFSGSFSNAADLSSVNDNLGNPWQVRYAGGTGNDLTLVAIPEPRATALGLLGVLALLRRRR